LGVCQPKNSYLISGLVFAIAFCAGFRGSCTVADRGFAQLAKGSGAEDVVPAVVNGSADRRW
jgi:hypothetical protein